MITPVDLENKEFKKSFRGYDIDEIESFLTELSQDYEKIYRENAGMKEKNVILNDAVENYKEMEETMRSAIISAQRTSEEILRNAHEQAETIVKEAKVRAQEVINEADATIQDLRRQAAEIEGHNSLLRAKLRAVLNTYLGMLDEIPAGEKEPVVETKKPVIETKIVDTDTIRINISEEKNKTEENGAE